MGKILVINGSIVEKSKSYSHAVTELFINEYQILNPDDQFEFLDLNDLPMANQSLSRNNFSEFFNEENSGKYIKQLKSVDKLILTCSMNNFAVPAIVKNYLDHIFVANETFSYKYSKKGDAIGLLTHLKAQIITTQGAPSDWYQWGNLATYLSKSLEFAGIKINKPLSLNGTKVKPLSEMKPEDAAMTIVEEIKKAAKEF
ncbi:FMN-dependent NADH-azoreductase [Spiroplasma endosymbiont of Crioceris asparagi]|uniref:FMN-dependent NADH-azoreductase n=1 Tax=Spiroplasma endosymbiont of Crioceris asparagi TaxID=3066286 RepID=UPI0030D61475